MDKGLGNKSYRSLNMPQKLAVARWMEAHPSECKHMTYDDLAKLISNEVSFEVINL
jgi:DNA-binding MurR/RpiR family transcriptional regulator